MDDDTTRTERASGDERPRECDLVMKGGITSGVVYPLAAVELSKVYRFRSIGGASAGAIAAALTAAAELGRQRGGASFARLEGEAKGLGANLRSLFQPSAALAPLFRILFAAVGAKGTAGRIARVVTACAGAYWPRTLAALAVAALVAVPAALTGRIALAVAAVVALLPLLLLVLWLQRLWRDVTVELPRHGYGLCPGPTQPGAARPGLVDWMAGLLDELALVPANEGTIAARPLTFGDLEGQGIELRAMTTSLTLGRPYSLPFENRLFHFRAEELGRLFPARVVAWMLREDVQRRAVGEKEDEIADAAAARAEGYYRVPLGSDLPVVVAVRMSLSFPVLFAAVPLHARDYTRREETAKQRLRRVWFSDGGLCRNFPIHLFDSLWPSRPTFGITLEPFEPESHATRVFLPGHARQGILRTFRDVESLGGFFGALVGSMQEWQDNLQSTLPGYRERIAHIALDGEEGGLNLDMDPKVIDRLVAYGTEVGQRLRDDFDWPAHRWTRVLSAVLRLDHVLQEKGAVVDRFVAERATDARPYTQTAAWQDAAVSLLTAWTAVAESQDARTVRGSAREPRPVPRLRLVARE